MGVITPILKRKTSCLHIVDPCRFHMFEEHLDDYLDDETERVKDHLEDICRAWEQQVSLIHLIRFVAYGLLAGHE